MKTFLTKSKSSLALVAILSSSLWAETPAAKPIAQVTELTGNVFVITPDGKTSTLKVNDHLPVKSEVMVDEGASVSLNDYYDATYSLVGGTHLKFFDKSVQLKRGKTWIQSKSTRHPLVLTTANGNVNFWKSEFVATFDQATSRSQFLVVTGEVEVTNILDQNYKSVVEAGSFTMIDPEVDNGSPRAATKVGLASLNSAVAEFKIIPAKEASAEVTRGIASVSPEVKRGEVIFMQSNRLPASVHGGAHTYWKKKAAPKTAEVILSSAPIRFYGVSEKVSPRTPASVNSPIMPKIVVPSLKQDAAFGESLKMQTLEQPKHPKELGNLLEELKSF